MLLCRTGSLFGTSRHRYGDQAENVVEWQKTKNLESAGGNESMLTYHVMTEQERETVSNWKYTGEYAIYNMPSYQEQKEKKIAFGSPKCADNYVAYYEGDTLIGFTNILEEATEVFMGIGVSPELCGQGYGRKILEAACRIAGERCPGKPLYLEVRTWNRRAVRCYERSGFRIDGQPFKQKTLSGDGLFFRMVHPA